MLTAIHSPRERADDALAISGDDAEGRSQREEAADWLRQALATGPMTALDVKQQAQINGIAERTLSRAKVDAGVKTKREGFGADGVWYWMLPDNPLAVLTSPHTSPHSSPHSSP